MNQRDRIFNVLMTNANVPVPAREIVREANVPYYTVAKRVSDLVVHMNVEVERLWIDHVKHYMLKIVK